MATAMIYDTLKLAEQLEHEAGFDASRAKAIARIMAENAGGNLATREDILLTKGELRSEIQEVRDEIQGVRDEVQGVRDEVQGVRDEVHGLRVEMRVEIQDIRGDIRLLYWISGTTLAGVAGLLSIAITIALHLMHLG